MDAGLVSKSDELCFYEYVPKSAVLNVGKINPDNLGTKKKKIELTFLVLLSRVLVSAEKL
jgi:hypothetical protein